MKLTLVLAPYDSGHRDVGFGAGPGALVAGGLVEALRAAGHDLETVDIGLVGDSPGREIGTGFAVCRAVAGATRVARADGRFPVILAGNCLTAAGAIAGEGAEAVVWFDQHGDLNTPETSPWGFLDGMSLAVVLGLCWAPMAATIPGFRPIRPERVTLVDARDLDPGERALLASLPVRHVPCGGVAQALPAVPTHLHLDLDCHDPARLRANAYATPGGPSPAELRAAAAAVAAGVPLTGVTVSAWDPAFDPDARVPAAVAELLADVLEARR